MGWVPKILFPFFLSISILSLSIGAQASEINDYGSCLQYSILNQKISSLSCQNSNHEYLMGFGMKYCLRFMTAGILIEDEIGKINWRSEADVKKAQKLIKFRKWVWGTMKCLQKEATEQIEKSQKLSCSSIQDQAFHSHRKCYEENGFCEIIPFWDDIVFKIIGFKELVTMLPRSTQMLGICIKR